MKEKKICLDETCSWMFVQLQVYWMCSATECSLSSVKSIIYHLFSILKSILHTIIFISITCEYIPYCILQQNNQSALLSLVLFWFPESAISL